MRQTIGHKERSPHHILWPMLRMLFSYYLNTYFTNLVHVWAFVLWLLMTQQYLCEHIISRIIDFITFRIACPALNTKYTNTSHWHLGNASLDESTEMIYDANVTLKCDEGYWLQETSRHGKSNTTQRVRCGLDGKWTPSAVDCAIISMNLCENYLTSLPLVQHSFKHKYTISCLLMYNMHTMLAVVFF